MNKPTLSEEQPRYVIDEGLPASQKEIKILSQEQERALQKAIKNAAHALTEEEKDLLYQLRDKLNRETERVQSLRKITVTEKPLDEFLTDYHRKKQNNKKLNTKAGTHSSPPSNPGADDQAEEEIAPVKTKHVVGFKPEEVVRRYIECWNQQKFGAEYDCFSRDFLTADREAYINARHMYYQQQLSNGGLFINFKDIESAETFVGDAEVVAVKTVQQGKRKPQEEKDRYRLKLENGRWVIYSVEPL
ncbi:MAG TPA: hypothetical protein PK878_08620 [bacterium]|nr:hypothetical protein [bacterium]